MNDIAEYYDKISEEPRLKSGWGRLELVRTQEILQRNLTPPPGRILDVGGATGVYSEWLGGLGYETHLLDLSPVQVEKTKENCRHIATAQVGDARRLPWGDGSFDAVLLMGPLYHLAERAERVAAVKEAGRVLRPGGLLFAAAIGRFASLMTSLAVGFFDHPQFGPLLDRAMTDGQHRNTTGDPLFFTTAFFHRPEEVVTEITEAGFGVREVLPVEGPGWMAMKPEEAWDDTARWERLLSLIRRVESEESLLGTSHHLLAVAQRPLMESTTGW